MHYRSVFDDSFQGQVPQIPRFIEDYLGRFRSNTECFVVELPIVATYT